MLQKSDKNFVEKKECRICGSADLENFIDFGHQPLANAFLSEEQLSGDELAYPLRVAFCHKCNLVQLRDVVDKEVLYRDYIYFSSGIPKLSNHFRDYAIDVMERFLNKDDFVVELASNDGILLRFFKENGYKILGIDPALNIAKVATESGIDTVAEFFSSDIAEEIVKKHGKAKVIMANNVVAHINDHHDLAKGVSILLDTKGVFVLEAPYLVDMFENLTYDTIYHEHLSYLAVRPLMNLFDKFGLEIFDVKIFPVQGQSLRVFVGKKGEHVIEKSVEEFVRREISLGLNKFESYLELAERIKNSKSKLVALLQDLKKEGKKIAAYGAPAKGNTLLNYCGIGTNFLDYAMDDLPSKQGLYSPGMHIPVVSRKAADARTPDYFIVLPWNYFTMIKEREKKFMDDGGKFIIPVGNIDII